VLAISLRNPTFVGFPIALGKTADDRRVVFANADVTTGNGTAKIHAECLVDSDYDSLTALHVWFRSDENMLVQSKRSDEIREHLNSIMPGNASPSMLGYIHKPLRSGADE